MELKDKANPAAAEHRRWMRELQLADKREKDWRELGKKIVKTYKGEGRKKNSFNILAANTETLRPAIYSSLPKPDVRRRFRDNDPLGKAVAEVMERCLSVAIDHYDFDECCRYDCLDALLPGRGVSRVRYVPSLAEVGTPEGHEEDAEEPSHEAQEGEVEEVEYEQVVCEHVDWEDFRRGYGRVWAEVQWEGFRHRLKKADVRKRFGDEVAEDIKYDEEKDDQNSSKSQWDDTNSELFKTAEFWEIWDKEGGRVFFLNEHHKALIFPVDNPTGEPPLKLERFFPNAEPLRLVEDSSSLIPTPVFELYKDQAEELERISTRINKIIDALKVRGVYDSTLKELSDLMAGSDNQMIPASNAAKWQANGGIEKAIWWMPVDKAAAVLRELYIARDACKATIYELTGISDIVRGQTNANETLGAQQLKSNYATMRLQRMQKAVQGYIRDTIRIMGEVVAEKFSIQTLQQMTGLKFPDAMQKQQMQAQAQMMSAQQQPIPDELQAGLMLPTWEEIKEAMSNDMRRTFRVDVETDSTVQGILQEDMTAMRDVLTGMVQFIQGIGPAVQMGAFPIEAVKSILLSIVRRSKLGLEVEDAIDKIKAPEAGGDSGAQLQALQKQLEEAQKALQGEQQKSMQREADYAKRDVDLTKREAAHSVERAKFDAERVIAERELAAQRDSLLNEAERKKLEIERAEDMMNGVMDKASQVAKEADEKRGVVAEVESRAKERDETLKSLLETNSAVAQVLQEVAAKLSRPRRVIYDPVTNRPAGIE